MKQEIKHGAIIDALTPDEAVALVRNMRERDLPRRVRAIAGVVLDANGNGQDEVFTCPPGWEFEARRVFVDIDTASSPNDGAVPLNVAGRAIEYLRSGSRIEYGMPASPGNALPSIPGVQSWGGEQGPYFQNGEVFEVKARGLTANARLSVSVEGIIRRPVSDSR